ncbi:His-Xaa-Ser repeat protein HxsA2 [Variovorax paradoxus]|uniref:His-Xaa-Ser repeat protein HxsA2 n=1 Tax=Variovorax paradoxus TaxID=34073 RepID=UPI0033939824
MKKAAFLIPVATAVASLGTTAVAAFAPASPQSSGPRGAALADPVKPLVLQYTRGNEQHLMLMQRDSSGVVMAYHQSHSSHSSHASHASHRSSAY